MPIALGKLAALAIFVILSTCLGDTPRLPTAGKLTASEIVARSVQANDADWQAAPKYTYTERDVVTRDGHTTRKTYRVLMIDGSDYRKLIAIGGEPLSRARARKEEQNLQDEIVHRRDQSRLARRKRVTQYQSARRQDHELMKQMIQAFDYKLTGTAALLGHRCYVVQATPRQATIPQPATPRSLPACAAPCGSIPTSFNGSASMPKYSVPSPSDCSLLTLNQGRNSR